MSLRTNNDFSLTIYLMVPIGLFTISTLKCALSFNKKYGLYPTTQELSYILSPRVTVKPPSDGFLRLYMTLFSSLT